MRRYCVVGSLTRHPPYPPLICYSSIELSSLSNPAEHVGSHSAGAFCCFAELGSDGIAALSAPLLGLVVALLQALKSPASAISISPRTLNFPSRISLYLVHCRYAAFRFGQSGRRSTPVTLGNLQLIAAMRPARVCKLSLC